MAVTAEVAATVKIAGIGVEVIAFGNINKGCAEVVVVNAEAKIGGAAQCEVRLGHLRPHWTRRAVPTR